MTSCLYVDDALPRFNGSSGADRAAHVLRSLVELFPVVHAYSCAESQPYLVTREAATPVSHSLSALVAQSSMLWAARPGSWPILRDYRRTHPDGPAAYDMVDDHAHRYFSGLAYGYPIDERVGVALLWERAAMRTSNCTVAVSEEEASRVREFAPSVAVVTNALPSMGPSPSSHETVGPLRLGFIGDFAHLPNADGVGWFVKDVMPQLPVDNYELTIAGYGSESLALEVRSNVRVLGEVRSLKDFYNSVELAIAPLRYGAGMKGKVAEAYAFGKPVLGTAVAFEGYTSHERWAIQVSPTPNAFLAALQAANRDRSKLSALTEAGRNSLQQQLRSDLKPLVADVCRRILHGNDEW